MIKPRTDQKFIEADELRENLKRGHKTVLIDVRSPDEFALGHISGAINIPADQLTARAGELPNDAPIITVCNFGGARSCGAADQLQSLGYKNTLPLRGGVRGWSDDQD